MVIVIVQLLIVFIRRTSCVNQCSACF